MPKPRVAVLSDIHGNRWALEAVLDDIRRRGIRDMVNLGDCLYGPLDPAGTARMLMGLDMPTVSGNEDRIILDEPGPAPRFALPAFRARPPAARSIAAGWSGSPSPPWLSTIFSSATAPRKTTMSISCGRSRPAGAGLLPAAACRN